jgi:hypothetical protein
VRENVDDDILTKKHFPIAHKEEREKVKKNGLIAVEANSSL